MVTTLFSYSSVIGPQVPLGPATPKFICVILSQIDASISSNFNVPGSGTFLSLILQMLGLQNCAIPMRSYSWSFESVKRRQFAASRKSAKHGKVGAKSKFAVPTDI